MEHARVSHGTRTSESWHTYELCHTNDYVMMRRLRSHVTHAHGSCDTYEWVMSHIRMSHGSCDTYEWVMSHIWMSHGSCDTYEWLAAMLLLSLDTFQLIVDSRHVYKWVMAHVWIVLHVRMCRVAHGQECCHTCTWVMRHKWMSSGYAILLPLDMFQVICCVMSLKWMSHGTHEMNESWHTWLAAYRWVMSHI